MVKKWKKVSKDDRFLVFKNKYSGKSSKVADYSKLSNATHGKRGNNSTFFKKIGKGKIRGLASDYDFRNTTSLI